MDASGNRSFKLLLVFFAAIIPALQGHIGEYDEYWKQRELEAKENTEQAYNPNPEKATQHVNQLVSRSLMGLNSTRRQLRARKKGGPCEPTNPIDQCWRCDTNWKKNRRRLADCAIGFGRGTIGGKNGRIYVVTDPSDDDLLNPKPGTLRHAVIQKEPLWIIFARGMIIRLKQELIMAGNKTIDARGANVHVAYGAGITIQYVRNVIIHGLHIHHIIPAKGGMIRDSVDHYGFRTKSDGDGVSLFGATNVWLDHLSMYKCRDGLIDAIQGSTAITISNCHFTHHDQVMLFGANDNHKMDKKMQITLVFNHFGKGLVQRMPRCRWGFIHVVNNDYTYWLMYAIGGSSHPTVISQGNRYVARRHVASKEVTKRDYAPPEVWKTWDWRSEGDLMVNGAFFSQSGDPNASSKFKGDTMVSAKHAYQVDLLTKDSGTLICVPGRAC
ncbi:hypothetical protein J1N35_042490 [Gossypium stocksii]|uniref:Pectate lyase n=1 Tax=Gossypium stocksii TaxID=47602 RepID=A0A9D3UHM3_9ROSI|nr:hypothetical protein J1N35_042490 [Gossypium stocksii]